MRPTTVITTPFGRFTCFEDQFAEDLRRYGAHQRSDLAAMRSFLRPGDWALDVGGFIGTITVPLAQTVGPAGRVVVFEPVSEHVALLRENVSQNNVHDRVTIVHALVTTKTGDLRSTYDEMSSATTHFSFGSGSAGAQADIPQWTVDAWLDAHAPADRPAVRLLKVDVEGLEVDVLEGAQRLVARDRPVIELEVGGTQLARYGARVGQLDRFLRHHGYHAFVNLAPRDAATDAFRLARLSRLQLLGPMLSDVVAVHPDSDGYPGRWTSWREAHQVVLAARIRLLRRTLRLRSRLSARLRRA